MRDRLRVVIHRAQSAWLPPWAAENAGISVEEFGNYSDDDYLHWVTHHHRGYARNIPAHRQRGFPHGSPTLAGWTDPFLRRPIPGSVLLTRAGHRRVERLAPGPAVGQPDGSLCIIRPRRRPGGLTSLANGQSNLLCAPQMAC